MDDHGADQWVCRDHCPFYKPTRTEEDRCRGYSLIRVIARQWAPPAPSKMAEPFDSSFKKLFLHNHVCTYCTFLIDGCDFTSPDPPDGCLPCGGVILLSRLLREGFLLEEDIRGADLVDRRRDSYLGLSPRCSTKSLEQNYIYHIVEDELFEVNEEGFQFLLKCNGMNLTSYLAPDPGFLDFCLREDLLCVMPVAKQIVIRKGCSPVPSLRYLEWLVTSRCNLSCSHCYLGDSGSEDFPPDLIRTLLDQFSDMQGLRILVSGGEPTLYRHFGLLNEVIADYPVRSVLLTNGLLLDDKLVSELRFHEVQISLDGMEHGHDALRGKGTFKKVVKAMESVRRSGLDLSVATMIHRQNLEEWDDMNRLVKDIGAREWGVDYPCFKGRWQLSADRAVDAEHAATKMSYGFGGSYHGTSPGWTCGHHLAAVLPSGNVCRCGLYSQQLLGSVTEGLEQSWLRVSHTPISQTNCSGCTHADTCGGGCRFRAGGPMDRDDVMCRFYGV